MPIIKSLTAAISWFSTRIVLQDYKRAYCRLTVSEAEFSPRGQSPSSWEEMASDWSSGVCSSALGFLTLKWIVTNFIVCLLHVMMLKDRVKARHVMSSLIVQEVIVFVIGIFFPPDSPSNLLFLWLSVFVYEWLRGEKIVVKDDVSFVSGDWNLPACCCCCWLWLQVDLSSVDFLFCLNYFIILGSCISWNESKWIYLDMSIMKSFIFFIMIYS